MHLLTTTKGKLAAGVLAGVFVLGGGGAVYAASNPTAAAVKDEHPTLNVLLNHSDHASIQVKEGSLWVTFDWDRGKVGAVSSSSITVDRPDGTDLTFAVTSGTEVEGVAAESDISVGSNVGVISTLGTALRITAREPAVSSLT